MTYEETQHVSVLLAEVVSLLAPRPQGLYIDGTLGGGGHTNALLSASAPDGRVLGIDTDQQALARTGRRFSSEVEAGRLVLRHGNYSQMAELAPEAGFSAVNGILLDLGFSSDQMDTPERGFSFKAEGPLDMRLNQSQGPSAADLLNSADEEELANIIYTYGEERRSRQIARRIVQERARRPLQSTAQLAELVARGVPYKHGQIHPATRTFQALRIAVNEELRHLELTLPQLLPLLREPQEGEPGGRVAIITFHSLEDRLVKEFFRKESRDCICPPQIPVCICGHVARLKLVNTKAIAPTEAEIQTNIRARSAKLRVAERIR